MESYFELADNSQLYHEAICFSYLVSGGQLWTCSIWQVPSGSAPAVFPLWGLTTPESCDCFLCLICSCGNHVKHPKIQGLICELQSKVANLLLQRKFREESIKNRYPSLAMALSVESNKVISACIMEMNQLFNGV